MPPRILMVICQFPPRVLGGAEKMAETFARAFKARGLLYRVVTSMPKSGIPVSHPDLPVDILKYPCLRVFGSLVYLVRLAVYLVRQRCAYDVIYLGLPKYEVILCALLGPWLRKPLVVKFESATWERQDNPVFRIRAFAVYEWALRRASAVVVLSAGMKHDLVARGIPRENIHVIPNAVDTQRFHPPANRESAKASLGFAGDKLVVFLGRLVKAKGVYELLDAFAALVQRGQGAHLLLIGGGPEAMPLRDRARAMGIDKLVTIQVSDDPSTILPAADLFVLPSYREGVSCALLEAMACGVCAVTTPVGGSVEVITDGANGQFIPARDTGALARTLEALLDGEGARNSLGRAGRASVVERYDLMVLTDRYQELFKHITRRLQISGALPVNPVHVNQT